MTRCERKALILKEMKTLGVEIGGGILNKNITANRYMN